jgi:hypothetical protein
MSGIDIDITARKEADDRLKRKARDLLPEPLTTAKPLWTVEPWGYPGKARKETASEAQTPEGRWRCLLLGEDPREQAVRRGVWVITPCS